MELSTAKHCFFALCSLRTGYNFRLKRNFSPAGDSQLQAREPKTHPMHNLRASNSSSNFLVFRPRPRGKKHYRK